MTDRRSVGMVLPAYNEENNLVSCTEKTLDRLSEICEPEGYEVIIVENGSTDRTPQIADGLEAEYAAVRTIHRRTADKGKALESGFRASDADVLSFIDTDLSPDLGQLDELIESVRSNGYDVAVGSRYLSDSDASRPLGRHVLSHGFNSVTRLLFRTGIRDHLCGFKAFDRDALFTLLHDLESDGWFWDAEILIAARQRGYRIQEIPINWESRDNSGIEFKSVVSIGAELLKKKMQRPRSDLQR